MLFDKPFVLVGLPTFSPRGFQIIIGFSQWDNNDHMNDKMPVGMNAPVPPKRAGTDELFEQPDHIRRAGNCPSRKEPTPTIQDATDSEMVTGSPANRAKDGLELFF